MRDNHDGFTFMETLFSIALILILTLAISMASINILRHNEYASATLKEAWLMLYGDQELRKIIEPIVFPYWENSVNSTRILQNQILNETHIPGIRIITATSILKDGSAHGIEVSYSIFPHVKQYKSIILFSSAGDSIKR